ncbi:MAG: restriction endonuclease subunit S [Anaerolineaceae bacterium]
MKSTKSSQNETLRSQAHQLPERWSLEPFSNVVDINCNSISADTPDNYSFYYLSLGDVDKGIINHPTKKINFKVAPERARRIVRKGEILLSTVRPNLQGFGYVDFNGDDYVCSTGFAVLRPKNKAVGQYLYQFLFSRQVTKYFYSCVVGSNYPAINNSDIERIPIPLPPVDEQIKISQILSTWDSAIERVQRLIEAKQRQKKGLMQGLLTGRLRFPEFGEPAEKVGDVPSGWEKTKLKNVSDIFISNVNKLVNENEFEVRLCNYMDVYSNEYITSKIEFMQGTASRLEISKFRLFRGDVLLTKDSETSEDIASTAVLMEDIDNLLCGYHLAILRPKKDLVNPVFLSKLLSFGKSHKHFVTHANGVTRYGLSLTSITNAPIYLPALGEQTKIADLIMEIDRETAIYSQMLEIYTRQKKGLMQKLLTGEIRVKVD